MCVNTENPLWKNQSGFNEKDLTLLAKTIVCDVR